MYRTIIIISLTLFLLISYDYVYFNVPVSYSKPLSENDSSKLDIERKAIEIMDLLLENAIINNNQTKWPRIADFPPDGWPSGWFQYYYGYNWGVSGIADTFLTFYSIYGNQSYLKVAEQAARFIIENAQPHPGGGLYWYTAEGIKTQYIGIKYGNAGIGRFLLHLYQQTKNATYLEYLNQTLKTLEDEMKTDELQSYWGIAINDTRGTVDIIYGTAGIAGVFLEAGILLNRQDWINLAIQSANWIENISIQETVNNTTLMKIPWSNLSPFNESYYTGYGGGNAGVGSFLIELYKKTGNEEWLEAAKKIANWLISVKVNKTWINGGPSYSTELDGNDPITGIDGGISGIGMFFLELFNETYDTKYAELAIEAANWLINNAEKGDVGIKWPKATSGRDNESYLTGISYGAAGIGLFLTRIYKLFGCSQLKEAALGAATWIDSQKSPLTELIPVATGNTRHPFFLSQYGHHLSFYDGLAGIGLFYLELITIFDASISHSGILSCESLTESNNKQMDYSQIENIILSFIGILGITAIIILTVSMSKKKKY